MVGVLAAAAFFNFTVDWSGGNHGDADARTLPTAPSPGAESAFAVRKLESFFYPPDGRVYGYADIVNFTDAYYPISYSSEVGVFSSPDGKSAPLSYDSTVPIDC